MSVDRIIRTFMREGVTIHGPWVMKIPEISLKTEEADKYILYLAKQGRMTPKEARAVFTSACQGLFNLAWTHGVKNMLADAAKQYRAKHPEDPKLLGFEPERLQGAYVPGMRSQGNQGQGNVKRVIAAMGRQTDE